MSHPELSVQQALARVLRSFTPMPIQDIPIEESLGRILAEDVLALEDFPPFDNSSMDGFAVRAQDVNMGKGHVSVELQVTGDIAAGQGDLPKVLPGTAVRIMTGAPLPPGADAVIPVEWTDKPEAMAGEALPSSITIGKPVEKRQYIRGAGEHIKAGDTILAAGRKVRPPDVGMLAMLGRETISVHRKPVVAILSTGDELVDVGEPVPPGHIRDSNSYLLDAAVREAGGKPLRLGIAGDDLSEVESRLGQAVVSGVDLIISSAGVSMGAFDVVRTAIESRGELHFWKVNLRPGKPLVYGKYASIPFLGLPGNPVSSAITFELFVRPAIYLMMGAGEVKRREVEVMLSDRVQSDGRESYLRAKITEAVDGLHAQLTGSQDSSHLKSLVEANGLVIVPAGVYELEPGQRVKAWVLWDG